MSLSLPVSTGKSYGIRDTGGSSKGEELIAVEHLAAGAQWDDFVEYLLIPNCHFHLA
jgi:hypothetical protein